MLLTAATGLRGTEADRRRYIRELAAVDVAAVIIELGRAFREVPAEMVEEARHRGLVLVELQRETPFIAITQAVHRQLISSAHETLTRALKIDDALNRLILEGAPLPALLELLAEQLGNPVVLEDGARHVVAFGRATGPIAPLLRGWSAHSRQGHAAPHQELSVRAAESTPACAWCPVALKGEVWGRLRPPRARPRRGIDRAAPARRARRAAQRGRRALTASGPAAHRHVQRPGLPRPRHRPRR